MGLIYKRTSPSGKYYIGKTTGPENIRWTAHVSEALNPNSNSHCYLLNKAIKKYGKDNFTLEILEDNIPSELLAEKEMYYIEKYKAYYLDPPYMGYNMTKGGEGVQIFSDEEILEGWNEGLTVEKIAKKIGASRPTVRHRLNCLGITEEERVQRGKELTSYNQGDFDLYKDKLINLYSQGKTVPEISNILGLCETTIRKYCQKAGISEEIKRCNIRKPVNQIDINTNEIINTHLSCAAAARSLRDKYPKASTTGICNALKGKVQTAYGFKWEYIENGGNN